MDDALARLDIWLTNPPDDPDEDTGDELTDWEYPDDDDYAEERAEVEYRYLGPGVGRDQ